MANVLFRRGTQEYINNNVPISDGQVVFNETDQAIYVDTPVNNVITRLRYGGGNLSRSDIDSALSDTSENPVQNKVITESVLQKTDIVNDYNTAVAVTATDIPVGCGVIKTANTKIGDLQTALNTTNGTVAQHTTDISALNTKVSQTSSRKVTPLNGFTIPDNFYRCQETICGFQYEGDFIAPQLSSDDWHTIAKFTSAFGNKYGIGVNIVTYDGGTLKKFDATIGNNGNMVTISIWLPSNMSEKRFQLKFYATRSGQ
jgi:hypothetical protein